MTISTFAELQTAISNWLVRTDSDVTNRSAEFIALAEAEINRVLRVRQMEASADITIDARNESLPTGFMSMRRIYLNTSPVTFLDYLPSEEFWERNGGSTTGRPVYYTLEGDEFQFGPAPDATYTGKCLYWKRQDVSASAHSLFVQNPDLYLYGALLHSAPFLRGTHLELVPVWQGFYAKALEQIRMADTKDRHSGASLQAYPRASV